MENQTASSWLLNYPDTWRAYLPRGSHPQATLMDDPQHSQRSRGGCTPGTSDAPFHLGWSQNPHCSQRNLRWKRRGAARKEKSLTPNQVLSPPVLLSSYPQILSKAWKMARSAMIFPWREFGILCQATCRGLHHSLTNQLVWFCERHRKRACALFPQTDISISCFQGERESRLASQDSSRITHFVFRFSFLFRSPLLLLPLFPTLPFPPVRLFFVRVTVMLLIFFLPALLMCLWSTIGLLTPVVFQFSFFQLTILPEKVEQQNQQLEVAGKRAKLGFKTENHINYKIFPCFFWKSLWAIQ